ncbi:MAG: hypothetical protein HUJ61_04965 [Bacilli bacterium]|nr:hypothetical protein [Bacilli bacterium]
MGYLKIYEKWFLGVDWSNFGSSVVALLWGVLLGAVLVVFLYLVLSLATIRKSRYIMDKRIKRVDSAQVEQIIQDAKDQFLLQKRAENPEDKFIVKIVVHEVESIAALYYPKSKQPMAELTVDEIILLLRYVTNTVDKVLGRKGLKVLKTMKLSTILSIAKIKDNKAVKKAEEINDKYNVTKVAKYGWMAIKFANPFYWFKKAVVDTSISLVTRKLSLVIIAIIGEQTNKVFSREALIETENQYDELLREIEAKMDEATGGIELPDIPEIPYEKNEFEMTLQEKVTVVKDRIIKEREDKLKEKEAERKAREKEKAKAKKAKEKEKAKEKAMYKKK